MIIGIRLATLGMEVSSISMMAFRSLTKGPDDVSLICCMWRMRLGMPGVVVKADL